MLEEIKKKIIDYFKNPSLTDMAVSEEERVLVKILTVIGEYEESKR